MNKSPWILAALALASIGLCEDRTLLYTDGKDKSISLTLGVLGGSYAGRSLSSKYYKLEIQPVKDFKFWFGNQTMDAKGKEDATTGLRSTFDARSSQYGARYQFRTRDVPSVGLSYIHHSSGDGTFAQTDGSSALYFGPKVDTLELDKEGWTGSYSRIKAGSRSADVLGLGYDGSQPLKGQGWTFVYGAKAFFERPKGTIVNTGTSVRAMGRVGIEYGSPEWGSVSLSAYVFPGGIPYTGTPLSGFTSFFLYEPGGVADDMRAKTSGYLDFKVSLKASF